MFTIDQIDEAHAKVKNGADFLNYIQDLIKLGVSGFETYVAGGHTAYFGNDGSEIQSEAKYAALKLADETLMNCGLQKEMIKFMRVPHESTI